MSAISINHVSIGAKDMETSVRFYEEVFGLERIPTYNFGFKTQYLRCGPLQVHVFELEDAVPRFQHFALTVDLTPFAGLSFSASHPSSGRDRPT